MQKAKTLDGVQRAHIFYIKNEERKNMKTVLKTVIKQQTKKDSCFKCLHRLGV